MEKKPKCVWYAYHGRRFMDADGIIVNTAAELEQGVLSAIAVRMKYDVAYTDVIVIKFNHSSKFS
jgi:hypothetical protein